MADRWRSPVPDGWPRLVDAHCRAVDGATRTDDVLVELLGGGSAPDTMSGVALRRWCAPVLDLEPHVAVDVYLARRRELGEPEVGRRLLSRAGVAELLVEADSVGDVAAIATAAGARGHQVLDLARAAERVLAAGPAPREFPEAFRSLLATAAPRAASVVGLAGPGTAQVLLDASPTRDAEATVLAGDDAGVRARDPRWHTWLADAALGSGLVLHVSLAHDAAHDRGVALPLGLAPFLERTATYGTPVVVLASAPFHALAASFAWTSSHVHLALGTVAHAGGDLSHRAVADVLAAAPFSRVLYASHAGSVAEHHYVAAVMFRRALGGVLHDLVVRDEIDRATSDRIVGAISRDNAVRVYGLS